MRKDMSHETCSQCGQGQYQETSIHDDWDGVLHCPYCNHEVKRYRKQEEFGVPSDLGIRFVNQTAVAAACNEACRDIATLMHSRKESGRPLPTSEVLAVGLQRLLSYGFTQENLRDCVDALQKKAEDLGFQKLVKENG